MTIGAVWRVALAVARLGATYAAPSDVPPYTCRKERAVRGNAVEDHEQEALDEKEAVLFERYEADAKED